MRGACGAVQEAGEGHGRCSLGSARGERNRQGRQSPKSISHWSERFGFGLGWVNVRMTVSSEARREQPGLVRGRPWSTTTSEVTCGVCSVYSEAETGGIDSDGTSQTTGTHEAGPLPAC